MDKVQIYYTCLIVLGFIMMIVNTTAGNDSPATASRHLPLRWALSLIIGLPVLGRIYGWW